MGYLVTASEMKAVDERTSSRYGMASLVLMERAAMAAFSAVGQECGQAERFVSCCGYGNNGGDGLALARLLHLAGKSVTVCMAGERTGHKISDSCRRQLEIVLAYGIPVVYGVDGLPELVARADCVVDALLGVGIGRDVEGAVAEMIACINRRPARTRCVSLDLPSGIHTDTGRVMGIAVRADVTVTFAFFKLGLALYPGCSYTGKVILGDAGITEASFGETRPRHFTYGRAQLQALFPKRSPSGHKGTFGKVLTVAGSRGMAGAAVLCARAAYRVGAGMVKAVTCETNRVVMQTAVPEALLCIGEEDLEGSIGWADALVTGPGLGNTPETARLMEKILRLLHDDTRSAGKYLVADADALNLLAGEETLRKLFRECPCHKIMTPHPGELSRLTGMPIEALQSDWEKGTLRLRREFPDTVLVCKDARTHVFAPLGSMEERVFVNTLGNDGMATAGSGDVLAGILGGLAGQWSGDAFPLACLGVALHGAAGESALEDGGKAGVTAGDLVEKLRAVCS